MTAPQTPDPSRVQMPPELEERIFAFERKLRRVETWSAVAGGVGGLLAAYVVVFLSDRVWDTPSVLRGIITLAGAAGLGFFVVGWMARWTWARRDERALARLIARRHPRLGDRLLGVVELTHGTHEREGMSEGLLRAAVAQVARDAAGMDFNQAIDRRPARRLGAFLLATLVLALIPVAVFPSAGRNAFRRWLRPFGDVERFTFVRLADLPDELVVARGEPFEILTRLDDTTRWTPSTGVARLGTQPPVEAEVMDGGARFRFPGQSETAELMIRLGDASRRLTVRPELRSELAGLEAMVHWPDYLEREPTLRTVAGTRVAFLRDASVEWRGYVNRELRSAETRVDDGSPVDLPVQGRQFSGPVSPIAGDMRVGWIWQDHYGLDGAAPHRVSVSLREDLPPAVSGEGLARNLAMLEEESVELTALAEDDFGVTRLWVEWEVDRPEQAAVSRGEETVAEASPGEERVRAPFRFAPKWANVEAGSLVRLRIKALDAFPGRTPSETAEYRIFVLTRAQHAELLQNRLQRVHRAIEEVARVEEGALETTEALSELDDAELAQDRAGQAMEDAARGEQRQADTMESLAGELGEIAQEALRNADIPAQTLQEWAELAEMLNRLAEQNAAEAAQSLQQGAESSDPGERRENLEEAMAQQRNLLEQLRQLEQQAQEFANNMQARNFLNRLRDAAQRQGEIAGGLAGVLPRIIGMAAAQIPRNERTLVETLAGRQQTGARDVGDIHSDLQGFYRRTGMDIAGLIAEEMRETRIQPSLEELSADIRRNRGGFVHGQTVRWQEQLDEWADLLEAAAGGGDGGGGDGDGGGDDMDVELIMGLMRARVQQESLREMTRALDRIPVVLPGWRERALGLGGRQDQIADDVKELAPRATQPELARLVEHIIGAMGESTDRLTEAQTGPDTIAIHTEIIELLGQSAQQSGEADGSAAAMAAMMALLQGQAEGEGQGMGMGQGDGEGGGSMAGGNAQVDRHEGGPGLTGRGGDGDVQAAAGILAESPPEFREALAAFYAAQEGTP